MSHSGGNHARVFEGHMDPLDLVDPTSLRILLIHSTSSCQNSVLELLRECSYQVCPLPFAIFPLPFLLIEG